MPRRSQSQAPNPLVVPPASALMSQRPMDHLAAFARPTPAKITNLMLADRLITLAQDAELAGSPAIAVHLVSLVYSVLDGGAPLPSPSWPRPVRQPAGQSGQFRRPAGRIGRASQAEA